MSRRRKEKKIVDEGVNYAEIKRNLLLRDTGGDLKRFRQRAVESKRHRKAKHKKDYQEQD